MTYIITSIVIIFSIFAVFLAALYVRTRFTKSYEKSFQEASLADENNEIDRAIKKYQETIQKTKSDNPILINIYLLLANALHQKGSDNDELALNSIDEAISLLKNKNVNRDRNYLKQGIFFKADFCAKISRYDQSRKLLDGLKKEYPNDEILMRRIDKKEKELAILG